MPDTRNKVALQNSETDMLESSGTLDNFDKERPMSNGISSVSDSASPDSSEPRGLKRSIESEEPDSDKKRSRTIIIDCDEGSNVVKDKSVCTKSEDQPVLHENINDSATNSSLPSQSLSEKFYCTACHKVAIEVHPHPILKVIICKDCKCLLEEKMNVKVWT